jgi:hypothetical protein
MKEEQKSQNELDEKNNNNNNQKVERHNEFTDSAVIIGEGDPNLSPTAGKPLI